MSKLSKGMFWVIGICGLLIFVGALMMPKQKSASAINAEIVDVCMYVHNIPQTKGYKVSVEEYDAVLKCVAFEKSKP